MVYVDRHSQHDVNSGLMKKRIAIFASGSGSNAENIVNYFKNNFDIEVSNILTNNPDAFVIERANKLKVPVKIFNKEQFYKSREVLDFLIRNKVDFIVLAGFLWLVPGNIIERFRNKIVNIHPALLPKYGGKGMYGERVHEAVSSSGDTKSGITIHYINEFYDEGDIIFRAETSIEPHEDPSGIAKKVHELEYRNYPVVIEKLVKELS